MDLIIRDGNTKKHKIQPYSFKNLQIQKLKDGTISTSLTNTDPSELSSNQIDKILKVVENSPKDHKPQSAIKKAELKPPPPPPPPPPSQDSVMSGELLKKIDEMSTNVIKLEMQMERQQEEFKERLEEEKERAYNSGYEKGKLEMAASMKAEVEKSKKQFLDSMNRLNDKSTLFDNTLTSLEKELSSVAMEIASEVISAQVSENSNIIAINLATMLLTEIKDASEVTIKANPEDIDSLKNSFSSNQKIKIESDSAVSLGGVIIMSNVGNINGTIPTRFEQIKKNMLESEN